MSKEVVISSYDPNWAQQYEAKLAVIMEAIGDVVQAAEHIGSTSIPGLAAKPILDVIVSLKSLDTIGIEKIAALEKREYVYRADAGIPGRIFFRKGEPVTKVHLHIVEINSTYWQEKLQFRDFLRAHPKDRMKYQQLKRDLAETFRQDRHSYTAGKTYFVLATLKKARIWRGLTL